MASPLKSQTILLASFVILVVYSFLTRGQVSAAANQSRVGGEGSIRISGFNVERIQFELNQSDPSRISNIHLDITQEQGLGSAQYVSVSVDQDSSWVICTHHGASLWVCEFPTGNQPSIRDITQLRVIARN